MSKIWTIRSVGLAGAAVAAMVAAGCGGSSSSSSSGSSSSTSTAAPAAAPAATTGGSSAAAGAVKVAADPSGALKFTKTTLHAKAGKVTLDLVNASSVPHSIGVQGNGVDKDASGPVTGGKSVALSVTLKPGTYQFYCPVDGHKAAGMVGKLIVQ